MNAKYVDPYIIPSSDLKLIPFKVETTQKCFTVK